MRWAAPIGPNRQCLDFWIWLPFWVCLAAWRRSTGVRAFLFFPSERFLLRVSFCAFRVFLVARRVSLPARRAWRFLLLLFVRCCLARAAAAFFLRRRFRFVRPIK